MARPPAFAFAIAFGVLLASCSGGGLGSMPYAGDIQTVGDVAAMAAHHPTGSSNAAASIGAFNALGSRVRDADDQNDEAVSVGAQPGVAALANGTCVKGAEFLAPDRNGDPESTESMLFYDYRCTHLARDTVRIFAPAGTNAETVNRTVSLFAYAKATTPIAVRTSAERFANATFASYGFPLISQGYARTMQGRLAVGNQTRAYSDSELVLLPSATAVSTYCQDSAGYNAGGIPSLDRTFGWAGGSQASPAATRTDNGGGYVTWSSTQAGTVYSGPVGSLSIGTGTPNTACPIETPAFAVDGGTAKNTYEIPMAAEFYYGRLWSLAITNASVHGGYTLNVATRRPANGLAAIDGTVSDGTRHIASFAVDAFGNGALTVTSTGAQYRIVDWTVVR